MRQLQLAAERFTAKHPEKPVALDLHFHPFQLGGGPTQLTETPVPRAEHYAKKFGAERTAMMNQMFAQKYRDVGLDGL